MNTPLLDNIRKAAYYGGSSADTTQGQAVLESALGSGNNSPATPSTPQAHKFVRGFFGGSAGGAKAKSTPTTDLQRTHQVLQKQER